MIKKFEISFETSGNEGDFNPSSEWFRSAITEKIREELNSERDNGASFVDALVVAKDVQLSVKEVQ